MRFHNGQIPESQTFDPVAAGWTLLRAPKERRFIAVAMLCTLPLRSSVLFFSLLHAALCVGDAATFLRLVRQAPPRSRVHNQG